MQSHNHHHRRESPPTATNKPPRPPPLSVSIPSDPDPPTRPTRPEPKIPTTESAHSPLRSDSPARSDDPVENTPPASPPKTTPTTTTISNTGASGGAAAPGAIVAVEKYYSPLTSPLPVTPPKDATTPDNFPPPLSSSRHHIISFNRREEAAPPQSGVYGGEERKGRVGFVASPSLRKESAVNKVALGFRVLEIAFCLVSFSVMAADKTQGWSGDSFDRYKEYRFCLAVNVLGFVYAGFQAFDLAYHLATGKHVIAHHYRYQFDFLMDQIIAYLLISASSASASRVDDWQANWGKDEFTEKASASISMAFLAFITFAMSSLISGYNLCTRDLS